MKKLISLALVLILVASMFASCSSSGKVAKVGLGHVTSIRSSKSLDGDVTPVGQVDTTIAAVGFDKNGKVVTVTIDTAQQKVQFDADLQLTSDVNEKQETKKEKKDKYGMKGASSIGKEWYEQIEELEKWMVGKTVDEIKSLKTKERDANHKAVPDDPELSSLVTITVQDYIAAVEEAWKNAVDVQGGAETVGLGHEISISKSKGLDGDVTPVAQVDTTMAATAFGKDGKIKQVIIDVAQTKVNFDAEGQLTSDVNEVLETKKEKKEKYGMKGASSIGKEWYEQAQELEKWMVGKTVDEVKNMKTKERDASHPAVPDEADLTSKVTITVQDYIAAVAESKANAK